MLGCGFDNNPNWAHGIKLQIYDYMPNRPDRTVQIYDNIIVEAYRYGIHGNTNADGYHYRNIIVESWVGEATGSALTEGTGKQANIYGADADDVGFKVWIDDGDYSNDDFSLIAKKPNIGPQIVKGFHVKQPSRWG